MRRLKWLYDQSNPDAHPVYEVRDTPTRILAYGLTDPNDTVVIETVVGPAPSGTPGVDYRWVPLYRAGEQIVLRYGHNHFLELIPGYYRIDVSGVAGGNLANLKVVAVEDEASNDSKGRIFVESTQRLCDRDRDIPGWTPPGPGAPPFIPL